MIWYKELEDHDTLYTNVTAIKLLEHLTEFCSGIHTLDAVDIPQVMNTLCNDAEGIPQYINAMEAAQRKSKRAKLVMAVISSVAFCIAREEITAIVDLPTDNEIINIRQKLLPVLMKTKYDELTLTHNLSGVIIPKETLRVGILGRGLRNPISHCTI